MLPHSSPVSGWMSSDSKPKEFRRARMDFEHFARFVRAADRRNASAYQKLHARKAVSGAPKSSWRRIAHDPPAAHEIAADRIAGLDEAFVGRGQEAELGEQQHAGVEVGRAERAGQRAALFVPGFGQNPLAQRPRARRPIFRPVGDIEPPSDASQPVAGRPAQRRGIRVEARAACDIPTSRRRARTPARARFRPGSRDGGTALDRPSSAGADRRTFASRRGPRCHRRRAGSGSRPDCRR